MRYSLMLSALLALAGGAQAADCTAWKDKLTDAFAGNAAPNGLTVSVKLDKAGNPALNIPRTNFSDIWLRVSAEACGIDASFVKRCRITANASKWVASCQIPELAEDLGNLKVDGWKISAENGRVTFNAEM